MDPRFSILTFPQFFDGAALRLRILVMPRLSATWNGDPLQPVALNPGVANPAFADADLQFEARTLNSFDQFPNDAAPDFVAPLPAASGVMPDARQLFGELVAPLADRFKLAAAPTLAGKADDKLALQKYLPLSYRRSFLFTGPRTAGAKTDDSYHCAVKAPTGVNPAFVPTPDAVSWGQIYAYCLRHPELGRRVGLMREASYPLQAHEFEHGGYLYVGLRDGSDYAAEVKADATFLKLYAARIPPLKPGAPRQLFAAVQFPVVASVPAPPSAPGNFDAVFIEAADYDDGFAKIVHAMQPVSQNLLAEKPDGVAPVNDIGIRLGWDDEQLLIWQNRQLTPDKTVPDPTQRLDAPMGVFGYRIDARQHPEADWHSLVQVHCRDAIRLGAVELGGPGDPPFELAVEVHPMQLDGDQANGRFWLPSYLSQWNGHSLVLPDEDAAALYKTEQQKLRPPPPPGTIPPPSGPARLGRLYEPVGLDKIPLRYGKTYELRVRLMDLTSGGPKIDAPILHDSPSPVASVPFRRHVLFEPVRIANIPKLPDDEDPALFTGNALEVRRPLLGYPSVVFTGKYADPIGLLQAASDAAAAGTAPRERFGIPDPDAQRLRIDVEVRTLRLDNLLSLSGTEPYIHLYSTERAFPAAFDLARAIPLEFRDVRVLRFSDANDIIGMTQAEIDALDQIVLPTARDIRLTIRAVADDDAAYFAPGAHVGKPIRLRMRRDAQDETGLIAPTSDADTIRGIYLQPDPVTPFDGALSTLLFARTTPDTPAVIQRLAQEIGVEHKGMTLVGHKGERVVFGCSRRIRNTLAPDNSSVTFAAKEDLINHWIVALTLKLDRDWSWDGLAETSFEIFRTRRFKADAPNEADDNGGKPIGDWEVKRVASMQALDTADRSQTRLIFLDAVEPKSTLPLPGDPLATRFPDLIELDYRIEPRFRVTPGADDGPKRPARLELPVTTIPAQLPRIVSAGIALSKYKRDDAYSSSEPRRRYLWLELAEPPRDPHDTYFIRLLGYAPDPLLSDDRPETGVPPEETPLAIDPELVRVIAPGATDDGAGLAAMTAMEPGGDAGLHFLVPLPQGLNADSPELFGFFTYELRVGHSKIWSTAQGRFGRALRATGVQHPPPPLFCTCQRSQTELVVEAPYARAVFNGRNITADPPRTRIWALLYAQVRQADGKDNRNILLDDRALRLVPRLRGRFFDPAGRVTLGFENMDAPAHGATSWSQKEIALLLRELGLPADAALSVLCVEMMPTLATLQQRAAGPSPGNDFVAGIRQARSGTSTAGTAEVDDGVRPLSDALGHFRILRTSPLTAVPAVC